MLHSEMSIRAYSTAIPSKVLLSSTSLTSTSLNHTLTRHSCGPHQRLQLIGANFCSAAAEVLAYFSVVMHRTFLPSGRVKYFAKHEYLGERRFRSMLTGKVFQVDEKTRLVDTTYLKVVVPSMRPPPYEVSDDVSLVTPNDLTRVLRPYSQYTVVGAGKTAFDAALWLLANNVEPERMTWIVPRDPWCFDRGVLQPGAGGTERNAARMQAIANAGLTATSPEDWLLKLEASEYLARVDESIRPTMFHCASVSMAELEQMRKIKNVIRKGRVVRIDADKVTLENGTYTPNPDTLYVDCTANGLGKRTAIPVFSEKQITLQAVRFCQQVFSAAFIAHIEATYGDDEAKKNELCQVIPHPDKPEEYLTIEYQTQRNTLLWSKEPGLADWLAKCRMNIYAAVAPPLPEDPKERAEFVAHVQAQQEALCASLGKLVGQLEGKPQ